MSIRKLQIILKFNVCVCVCVCARARAGRNNDITQWRTSSIITSSICLFGIIFCKIKYSHCFLLLYKWRKYRKYADMDICHYLNHTITEIELLQCIYHVSESFSQSVSHSVSQSVRQWISQSGLMTHQHTNDI